MPRMYRGASAVFREEPEGTNSHLRLHIPQEQILPLGCSSTMRGVTISVVALAASGVLASTDDPKPTFTVLFSHRHHKLACLRSSLY